MVRLLALRERLRSSLWLVPSIFAAAAVVLALVVVEVDRRAAADADLAVGFGGTADGARSMLSTIAQSMLAFTGLVFTITMLVLQLASSQLSPRVMRTFLRDRGNQVVLGIFVATFVYTLLVLRDVRSPVPGDPGFVPGIAVGLAFALLLASVGAFIYYIDHMAHAIRASTVIGSIWAETAAAIGRRYPEGVHPTPAAATAPPGGGAPPDVVLESRRTGVIVGIDVDRLRGLVDDEAGRAIEIVPRVGSFVPEGGPMARLWGPWPADDAKAILDAIGVGDERTLDQDVAFGFRQLVDIALRALSPGTNDPTTATQAMDRIHDLLRRLVVRQFPTGRHPEDGEMRLQVPEPTWPEYLHLGVAEIREAGVGQLQVQERLRGLLADLAAVATTERQAAIRREQAAVVEHG